MLNSMVRDDAAHNGDAIQWDNGYLHMMDPARIARILPNYFQTDVFSSFLRQCNNVSGVIVNVFVACILLTQSSFFVFYE